MERPHGIPEYIWQKAMLTEEACINETWNGSAAGSKQKSAAIIAHAMLAAVNEEREACARLIEEGFDRDIVEPYREDGKPSKNDICAHDKFMYEDCEMCAVAAIRARTTTDNKEQTP